MVVEDVVVFLLPLTTFRRRVIADTLPQGVAAKWRWLRRRVIAKQIPPFRVDKPTLATAPRPLAIVAGTLPIVDAGRLTPALDAGGLSVLPRPPLLAATYVGNKPCPAYIGRAISFYISPVLWPTIGAASPKTFSGVAAGYIGRTGAEATASCPACQACVRRGASF